MFISNFALKTRVQRLLFTLQDFLDFPRFHPAREMKKMALRDSVRYARRHMHGAMGLESAREVLTLALRQAGVQGHYMEFGVYMGGTIRFIAKQAGAARTIHGFDSFRGLEEAWSGDTGDFDAGGRLPKVPKNVVLHKGRFEDTLSPWAARNPGPVAFLHVDCDLYESTRCVFENLQDRLVPGTIIVFDEYFNYPNWQEHEYKAFQEMVLRCGMRYEYLAYARFQVAVKITGVQRAGAAEIGEGQVGALNTSLSSDIDRQPV